MVAGDGSSRTLTRDPEVLWATHQGRGLSWREGQGYGSPVAAFFFFKSRRMRRDRTPHSVDNPWSTQRGRRCLSSLSGRPRLSTRSRVVLVVGQWRGCAALRPASTRRGRLGNGGSPSRSLTILGKFVGRCRPPCQAPRAPRSCSRVHQWWPAPIWDPLTRQHGT